MLSRELLEQLRASLQDRRIHAGIALLDQHRSDFAAITPQQCLGGLAVGCLAQWLDVGFECEDLLLTLLDRFHKSSRHTLPLTDYIHLRLAEAVIAMRREDLSEALRHLDTALMVSEEIGDSQTVAMASLWKARCLRKAGEYDQALEITQRGRDLARSTGLHYVAAVIQTLESWLLFQKSETKEAVRILQEAEAVLRHTDDFITLGKHSIDLRTNRASRRPLRPCHAIF